MIGWGFTSIDIEMMRGSTAIGAKGRWNFCGVGASNDVPANGGVETVWWSYEVTR